MKTIFISIACLFLFSELIAQNEADSLLTNQEISFRDSINAINLLNENIKLTQETFNKANALYNNK